MQLQITNIWPQKGPLPHVKHLSETQIIKKHCNETKQKAQWRPEARSQEYHKQNTMRDIHAVIKSI